MKALLVAINAKYIHSNPAIYSLRAYAGTAGQEFWDAVELAEYTINQPFLEILADIYGRKPTILAFSCYIWNVEMILKLVTELHKILPEVPIWLGGPEVSYDAPDLLEKHPAITGVMIGEGEETFRELMDYYIRKPGDAQEGLRGIAGLCIRDGYTAVRKPLDMNSLPFLYKSPDVFENKIIYYESSRGCPFRCSYCLSSIEKTVRLRDLEIVKRELQFFLDHRVKQVKFVDRTFNCNRRHAMSIWQHIFENDNGVTNFHFEVAGDLLTEEEIAFLRRMRPGLVQLEIGVQSVNPKTLEAIHRTMNVEKLEKTIASVNQGSNVHLHLDLIAGLPHEDYESFRHSFDRVYEMAPEQLQLGFLKVLKGSEMHCRAEEFGICYLDQPPYEVLFTKWLSFDEVVKLKRIAEMVEIYYNSSQFRYTLQYLVRQFTSPFSMFEKLEDFYERRGYFANNPARAYRYQVLLEFAMEWERNQSGASEEESRVRWEIYRELLTFDMYLRENLKSRPGFAGELSGHKEFMRQFYLQEEQDRRYLAAYKEYDHKQLSKMTHLEPFHYPVWESKEILTEKRMATAHYVLFDYDKRNPLTSDAAYYVISPDRKEEELK